ncbi:hypothetical protein JCM19992_23760 [Thermostilla marina]
MVDGPEGAFAFAYGDFNGHVRSASGDAGLVAIGNAVGDTLLVSAGASAGLWVVGDALGRLQAGQYGEVLALGSFHGQASATADLFLGSEGTISGSATAGGDLAVFAFGSVTGNFHAGRDAAVQTYGDFAGSLSADRDLGGGHWNYYGTPALWARGDITGYLHAGRNIGCHDQYYDYVYSSSSDYDIFAFGSIDAVITADNPSGSELGGRIGSIGSWGAVDGTVRAAHSIGRIRAGGEVSAELIAPQIGSVVENDPSIQTDHPWPELPPSVVDQVLADAQQAYQEVLTARDEVAQSIDQLLGDFAAERTAALEDLAATIAQTDAAIANTAEKLAQSVARAKQDAYDSLYSAREAFRQGLEELRAQVHAEKEALGQIIQQTQHAASAHWWSLWFGQIGMYVRLRELDRRLARLCQEDERLSLRLARAHAEAFEQLERYILFQRDPLGLIAESFWEAFGHLVDRAADALWELWTGPGDWLDKVDRFAAGFADIVSFGMTTKLRELLYGEIATRNHQGIAFRLGQVAGIVHSIALGYQGARYASAVAAGTAEQLAGRWAFETARYYIVAGNLYGLGNSTYHLLAGDFRWHHTLGFLPLGGFLLSRAKPTMSILFRSGRPFHVYYGAMGRYLHAIGDYFNMTVEELPLWRASRWFDDTFRIIKLPVLFPRSCRAAGNRCLVVPHVGDPRVFPGVVSFYLTATSRVHGEPSCN